MGIEQRPEQIRQQEGSIHITPQDTVRTPSVEVRSTDADYFLIPVGDKKIRVLRSFLDKILTLDPSDPSYPLKKPFQDYYPVVSDESDERGDYEKKYALAMAFVEDGRYRNLRFLVSEFIARGEKVTPEIEALKNNLEQRVHENLLQRSNGKERKKAEEDLRKFAKDIKEGKTLDAEEFRILVGLFDASYAVDILYRSRPEFRGIPVERVSSILADYIGDFLATKGTFNPDNIKAGIKHLSDANLQEALYEVIKNSALSFFHKKRKTGTFQSDREMIEEYMVDIGDKMDQHKDFNLNHIVELVSEYYRCVFEDFKKPAHMVDSLKEGRLFPDTGQLINTKEIADKKKVLIADGMGTGKSGSVVYAKESLGLKQAVVVAPSNVIPTWQEYLSDKVAGNGKQVGYFKEGQSPKVLTVENLRSLKKIDSSSYDYILVSHEKLNNNYTEALEQIDYDMLIVDEVHKLKNLKDGKRASNLLKLAKKIEGDTKYLALLSGTPVPNKVGDLAMILKLLYPEKFQSMQNKDLVTHIIQGEIVDLRRLLVPRMQMKSLRESIELPEFIENTIEVELSPAEKEIYEILLEDDEVEAKDKIRILRQFLINPALLNITPGVKSSKAQAVGAHLTHTFQEKDKVVMFVNDYIEDVIRGDYSVLNRLELPQEVGVRVIHGEVNSNKKRKTIQSEFKTSDNKVLLAVSGKTADVGVDFSAADEVAFYNEPWTKYDKQQQLGRADREGLQHSLTSTTFIAENTIEAGIHNLIEKKYQAIQKLLRGIPRSDLEKELLEKTEDEDNLEVNPELAAYYFSTWDRMKNIFGFVKELGEEKFVEFLSQYGKDYADGYTNLGSRSYQANASRVCGTLIDTFIKEKGQDPATLKILDIGSGPEMLRKHSLDNFQDRIYSLDINEKHFTHGSNSAVVGSMLNLPIEKESMDYAALSLVFHYTQFIPSQDVTERLELFREAHRVLKTGGRAVFNLIYSSDIKDMNKFRETVQTLGFKMIDEYSGEVQAGRNYKSRVITLEKQDDLDFDNEEILQLIGKENYDGLKLSNNTNYSPKDSRKVLKEFEIGGKKIPVALNENDKRVVAEEEQVTSEGEELKRQYGEIKNIPSHEVIQHNFIRILVKDKYLLFKRLRTASGVVLIK